MTLSLSLRSLRTVAARLPNRWQTELKRIQYSRQIAKDHFVSPEPEFELLSSLVKGGDWVLDVGANVGHYTRRLSGLVGPRGRVIAFEPVPVTFSLLSANTQLFQHQNVSLINAAVSDKPASVGMRVPQFSTGLVNYYDAHLSQSPDAPFNVLTLSIDSLCLPTRISLIKVDAEDHELFVLGGMQELIKRDHPILIVETGNKEVFQLLTFMGYQYERIGRSPNLLCRPASPVFTTG